MSVAWTPEAQQDRADIFDHIEVDNPFAAVQMDTLFSHAEQQLVVHP